MTLTLNKLPIILSVMIICFGTISFILPTGEGSDSTDIPTRSLYGYEETLNVSFNKPDFYDEPDPHYNHENLEDNTWDDIGMVVLLQDKNTITKNENQGSGSSTAECSDIYQAAFVPLDGSRISTGRQQRILVEDFTATWCGYCTAVIGSLSRLDHDETMWPNKYIGIEWHSGGGTYGEGTALSAATERRDSYELSGGIPRYVIDGMDPWVGGSGSANDTSIDNRIRNSISSRTEQAPISIQAHAGHTSSKAWVEFTFKVEDQTFDNDKVEAHVFLVQDAYPRRHGTNPVARLGWIGQDIHTQDVMQLEPPGLSFGEITMQSVIDQKGYVEGEFDILWQAYDKEDLGNVDIDLYYRMGYDDWVEIASGIPNSGSFTWDTLDPRVPDGDDYQFKVVGMDSDGMSNELETSFRFEINNPDPPTIIVSFPMDDGEVMTKTGEVKWRAWDGEQDQNQLTIDLWISSDGGATFTELATDLENSGSYTWDILTFADGTEYVVKMQVTDTTMLKSEALSPAFEIFNNDIPVGTFIYPDVDEVVEGEITVTWDTFDEEDEPGQTRFDLYIRNLEDGVWTRIASDQVDTGSITIDTTTLEQGDGEYELRLILKDSHGEYSDPTFRLFEVYNPDAPVISNTVTPRSPVSGTIAYSYTLMDPDAGESALLSPSFHMSTDGQTFDIYQENAVNTGTLEIDTTEMIDGTYYLKIVVMDPVVEGLESSFVFPAIEVNNPDAPVIGAVSLPTSGDNITGETALSWNGEDLDDDTLRYYLYYSNLGDPSWYPIADAQGIISTSYVWNTSELESGDYQLRILVKDGSKASLEDEIITDTFQIYTPREVNDGPSGNDNKSGDKTGTSSNDQSSLIILIIVGMVVIILLMVAMAVVIIMKRKQQPAMQAPPPNPQMQGLAVGQLQLKPQIGAPQRPQLPSTGETGSPQPQGAPPQAPPTAAPATLPQPTAPPPEYIPPAQMAAADNMNH